jgi:uncharacterized membrane protein YgcG
MKHFFGLFFVVILVLAFTNCNVSSAHAATRKRRSKGSSSSSTSPSRSPTLAPPTRSPTATSAPTAMPTILAHFSWNPSLQTNISDRLPADYKHETHDILSVRQVEFDHIILHAQQLPTLQGWAANLAALSASTVTSSDFPGDCLMIPQGLATRCDWVLLFPCFYGNLSTPPRTIFVHHFMLPHFTKYLLPMVPGGHRFVLVTSGTDLTIPSGRGDIRFPPLPGFDATDSGGPMWKLLTQHPQIIRWYCENHDLSSEKVATLPTGVVDGVAGMQHITALPVEVPLTLRRLMFLVLHRIRSGLGQWGLRRNVSEMCHTQIEEHVQKYVLCMDGQTTGTGSSSSSGRGGGGGVSSSSSGSSSASSIQGSVLVVPGKRDHRGGIKQSDFVKLAQAVSFVLCVHGGGLDPSPKAWETLLLGTIPIIQHSTLDDAYSQLPVVFVDDFSQLFGPVATVSARLAKIRAELDPYYSNTTLRAMVLEVTGINLRLLCYVVYALMLRVLCTIYMTG